MNEKEVLINEIKNRLFKMKSRELGEEATKQTFVIPFMEYLGYDPLNTLEVFPEYTAGEQSGEAVDYALLVDGKPSIFIEVKKQHSNLVKHINQLSKYIISDNNVNVGILTNGLNYLFFLKEKKSVYPFMYKKPFYQLNISRLDDSKIEFLNLLGKTKFSKEYLDNTFNEEERNELIKRLIHIVGDSSVEKIFDIEINNLIGGDLN